LAILDNPLVAIAHQYHPLVKKSQLVWQIYVRCHFWCGEKALVRVVLLRIFLNSINC